MNEISVVCGANGYVGRNLVAYLIEKGHEVRAVSRSGEQNQKCRYMFGDLTDPEFCKRATADATWVYNLAANVGGIGYIGKQNANCMVSVLINTNLLRVAAQNKNLAGFLFASSSCVYPSWQSPLTENLAVPNWENGYGFEKFFSEKMCGAFKQDFNVPVRIARYHTIYGPGDWRGSARDHFPSALCQKVVNAKLSGVHEINIWGDGSQTRSLLYIDDCVEGTHRIMRSDCIQPINLGTSTPVSVNSLVTQLEDIAGIDLLRFYAKDAPVGCTHKTSDNTFIKAWLNWEPTTQSDTGLRKLYADCYDRALKT